MRRRPRWSCCAAAAPPAVTSPVSPPPSRPGRCPADSGTTAGQCPGRRPEPAMTVPDGPFTDQALVRGPLYASADRLARRSSALHRARVAGRHAGEVITDLAKAALAPGGRRARVADIGCGRGTTTRMLAQRLPGAAVAGLDLSAALLAAARERPPEALTVRFVRADFCRLPLAKIGRASCR